jgi:hypothetical protein
MTRKKIMIKTRPAKKAINGDASTKSFIPLLSYLSVRPRIKGMTDPQANEPKSKPGQQQSPTEFYLSKELAKNQRTRSDVRQVHDFLRIHLPLVAGEPFHTSVYPFIRIPGGGRRVKLVSSRLARLFMAAWLFSR